jgi:hypothetical protein
MNSRFSSFFVLFTFSAFTLFSCSQENNRSEKKSPRKTETETPIRREVAPAPSCQGVECLSQVDWRIYLQGQNFPDKILVKVNGSLMIDECLEKQKYSVKRGYNPEFIYFDKFKIPSEKKVQVDIYDLGSDCQKEELFLSKEEEFTLKNLGELPTIEIYL